MTEWNLLLPAIEEWCDINILVFYVYYKLYIYIVDITRYINNINYKSCTLGYVGLKDHHGWIKL